MSGLAPAVDVVIPVYNAPGDVRRCVASVLAHTPFSYRLVLIDDASPDPGVRACSRRSRRRGTRTCRCSPTTATSASPERRTAAWRCRGATSCS
jgi:cellulose synthase/poly-beta-1,6-N-acetylglucosamine synthase-like glycosyltransferase